MSPAASIDEFLAPLAAEVRAPLEELRRLIREAAPDATEGISYGVPGFKYRGRPLVSIGAGKSHRAFYVQSPAVMRAFVARLAGFDTAKGTVRFTPDRPLPPALVQELVKARMAETDAAEAAKRAPKRG